MGLGGAGRAAVLRVTVSNADQVGLVSPKSHQYKQRVLERSGEGRPPFKRESVARPGRETYESRGEPKGPWVHLFVEKGSV